MRYAHINSCDLINTMGGVSVSLWVQGCPHRCEGCHNPETWDFSGGKEFDDFTLNYIIELLKSKYVSGLSILGGEPFAKDTNDMDVLNLVKKVKEVFGNSKTVVVWSGYQYDYLKNKYDLSNIDYIVDGLYIKNLPTQKPLRGSDNQNLIDIKGGVVR